MSIFRTDLEAIIYIIIIMITIFILNRGISFLLGHLEGLLARQKNKINFVLKLFSIGIIIYLLIEGFPSFTTINPEYTAIITSATSTALAFATSGVFANFMAGILLLIIDPFDIGDIVKIKGQKGVIKDIRLTKIVIQTFDFILLEISNREVIKSQILNYTINLNNIKTYENFKKKILAPQDIGKARLDIDILKNSNEEDEHELRELYSQVSKEQYKKIHSFTFKMQYPYQQFRIKVDKTEKICSHYNDIFGFKPHFHIMDLGFEIGVKFRIFSLKTVKLLTEQPLFAKEIYKIIME